MEVQSKYELALSKYNTHLHDDEIMMKVDQLIEKHLGENNNIDVKKEIFHCIDLTTLKCTDSEESVMKFTEKVNEFVDKYPDLENVAAICVYPNMAEIVSDSLEADNVKIACVSGGFPSSQTFMEVKVAETAMALHAGAEEIDIVMPIGKFLCGDYEGMCDEIGELKDICGEKTLKVILETGALRTASNIKKAAILAMYAGADFIKTSTGKEAISATPEAALVMCEAIKEYYKETGRKVGFKAAGGIDSVMPIGKFLCGDYEGMCDEIGELKDICGEKPLKVILETGALRTASNIKKAAILAMYAGADFIKTSTGKKAISATPEAALIMCEAIKEYHRETGRKVGFKAAGGIDSVKKALAYYTIVKEVLGEEWLNNGLFRIGTSQLTNLLLSDIIGEEVKFF